MYIYLHCPWISWLPRFHVSPAKEKEAEGKSFSSPNRESQLSMDRGAKAQVIISIHPLLHCRILSYQPRDIAKEG